ncbi:MAG: ABC transporter substrate-binding protein [Deltaproteobacteria bacterium]|nr:ABC transporter substrate-binding protein [Deltaproteobacteria bacterium]
MVTIALYILVSLLVPATAEGASSGLIKAKQEAEAKGFIFEAGHDEIVEKARKEGRLRAIVSLDSSTFNTLAKAFREKYSFLDVRVEEVSGTEASQRFLLELKAGRAQGWDISYVPPDTLTDYLPHGKKVDLLGMAEHGVLAIPTKIIDPKSRKAIAVSSTVGATAFNRCILDASKVPERWEDFLKPEFKGRKFIVDVRPLNYTSMAAGAGEEWMASYARKIATQQPVWLRGQTRALTSILAGEYGLHSLTNYQSVVEAMQKDRTGCLQVKVIEPVPVRLSEPQMIVEGASHFYAGMLWLEFMASPIAQRIIDEKEPLKSSIYIPGSALEKIVRGKKVWVLDWNNFEKSPKWVEMALEAFGFPQAQNK